MVRTYKRKTTRCDISEENVQKALDEVLKEKKTVRTTAEKYGLKKSMLSKRLQLLKSQLLVISDSGNSSEEDTLGASLRVKGRNKYCVHQVFSDDQENMLSDYLTTASAMHYGLTYNQARKLAYEYAAKLKIKFPSSWERDQTAGLDWIKSFMKRHQQLSLRKPENTSLARATAFNRTNVAEFFDNYSSVMDRYHFPPNKIFNLDETGVSTVLPSPKVIAETGKKQIGQVVARERGELVTVCCIIAACGNSLPPVFVFPKIRLRDCYLAGAPTGSLGLPSSSGWMTADLFINVLQHVQQQTNCASDNPILLLLDNHASHITVESVSFAKDHGIILLTIPPHCSHRMQPLDISVFGPFKAALRVAFNDLTRSLASKNKVIRVENIASLVGVAYINSFTPKNILSSFSKTGIWPFNRLIFSEEDFLGSYVSDRPLPNEATNEINGNYPEEDPGAVAVSPQVSFENVEGNKLSVADVTAEGATTIHNEKESIGGPVTPSASHVNVSTTSSSNQSILHQSSSAAGLPEVLRLESLLPFPKAGPRKEGTRGRKRGKSRIFTDTPEKRRLEELEENKKIKKGKKDDKQSQKSKSKSKREVKTCLFKSKKQVNRITQKKNGSETEESDGGMELLSENEGFDFSDSDSEPSRPVPLIDSDQIKNGDFLMVKFTNTKNNAVFYVGQVQVNGNEEFEVKYLRKKGNKFVFPDVDDISVVLRQDIYSKLPRPKEMRGTKRTANYFTFEVNFCDFYMK